MLLERIKRVHTASREPYGSPRVQAELRARGEKHSRKRIERLMREAGLMGASHRRGGPTTTRRDQEARPAPDRVDRDFTAAGPNQLWIADITFIPTTAGFLCLAVVLDACRCGCTPPWATDHLSSTKRRTRHRSQHRRNQPSPQPVHQGGGTPGDFAAVVAALRAARTILPGVAHQARDPLAPVPFSLCPQTGMDARRPEVTCTVRTRFNSAASAAACADGKRRSQA